MREFIISMAKEAGNTALNYFGKIHISSKGEKNIVTNADKDIEARIISRIKDKYPEHNIVSEESGNMGFSSDFTWFIDPIDGTNNFAHTDPNFCISIALAQKGVLIFGCVYIPAHNECFFAQKGKGAELNGKRLVVSQIRNFNDALIHVGVRPTKKEIDETINLYKFFSLNADRVRDYGFCAGELAYLSAGRADGLLKLDQNIWDVAAGILLVQEAGGRISDTINNEINFDKTSGYNIACSNSLIHLSLLEYYNKSKR
jgi:myo-inositol-1(or 4)-monophosphatase